MCSAGIIRMLLEILSCGADLERAEEERQGGGAVCIIIPLCGVSTRYFVAGSTYVDDYAVCMRGESNCCNALRREYNIRLMFTLE